MIAPAAAPAAPRWAGRLVAAAGIGLAVAYPAFVYWGLLNLRARSVSLVLLVGALATIAFRARRAHVRSVLVAPIAVAVVMAAGALTDDARLVLALPVLINAALLVTFGATLRSGATPMVERFARLQKPDLPAREVRYCRSVTVVWCVFFVVNGAIALGLALAAPLAWWTLWTGVLSYVAMGLLFASEWLVRRAKFGGA